jgi:hypothetical protein
MKNTIKLFEAMRSITIIALVAIIGFSFAACGGDDGGGRGGGGSGTGGTFTLTNIPAEYEGKYVDFGGANESESIMVRGSASKSYFLLQNSVISNGSVSLPMWIRNSSTGGTWEKYTDNDTLACGLNVYDTAAVGAYYLAHRSFGLITFSKGSAAKSWDDGY